MPRLPTAGVVLTQERSLAVLAGFGFFFLLGRKKKFSLVKRYPFPLLEFK